VFVSNKPRYERRRQSKQTLFDVDFVSCPQSMIKIIANQPVSPGRPDESEKKLLKSRSCAACIEVNNRTSDPVVDDAFRYRRASSMPEQETALSVQAGYG